MRKTTLSLKKSEMITLSACLKMQLNTRPYKNSSSRRLESLETPRLRYTRSTQSKWTRSRRITKTLLQKKTSKSLTFATILRRCNETTTKRWSRSL